MHGICIGTWQRARIENFWRSERVGRRERARLKGRQPSRNANEGADGSERRTRASERARGRRAAATSAARFNYTLQTHDMSKSYTSYRLRHLLKVSSRAPCSARLRPLLFRRTPKEYRKDARNIRTKSSFQGGIRPRMQGVADLRRPPRDLSSSDRFEIPISCVQRLPCW